MADTIKIVGEQVALTSTGNTVGSASCVRVSLIAAANVLVSRQYANGTTIGTIFLGTGDSAIVLVKSPTDLIAVNTSSSAVATPISFT